MDPYAEEDKDLESKTIDIYQHLKINLNNPTPMCDCGGIPSLYCIPCKVSVCRNCTYDNHKTHILISKENSTLDENEVDKIFHKTEQSVISSEVLSKYPQLKEALKEDINKICQILHDKVDKMKKNKLNEIEHMFDNLQKNSNGLQNQIDSTKNNLREYFLKNKKFFGEEEGNMDEMNTLFLMNYDIFNIGQGKEKEIKTIIDILGEDYKNYQISNQLLGKAFSEEFDKILFGNNYSESLENEINSNLTLTANIKRDILINDEKYHPLAHFKSTVERVNQDHYKDINDRLEKYSKEIDSFKKKVYNAFLNNRTLKEIENEVATFEHTKSKGAENLFCQRKSENGSMTMSLRSRTEKPVFTFKSKEDVTLIEPLLKKYFAYLTIDLYGEFFKIATKELQSSHADLMIRMDPEQDDESDYAKVVEGTNTLIIYQKKTNRMIKKKLNLTRNPFGYTLFPTGSRCILIGKRVYISGGVDEKGEYPNVLIYDLETEKLKRIMDMIEPRSYHTMIYNDAFETLMVLGGECSNTVEIFDPMANRWQMLPPLNYPRANVYFHFDKPRGLMFALLGQEGKIVDNKFSDVIEVLDLTEFRKGWCKVDYYNRAEISLRKHMNIFPLSNCLLLAYGGETGRKTKRIACLINLMRYEIQKIDKQTSEQIAIASKKSPKLSNIMSNLNLSTSKVFTEPNNESYNN
ncbi:MAG: hypothetical protein MJ252_05615 [archaeon]|nr:hypothetical protein [archaeon]